MVGCVLSQLKPSELYILSFEKAKNVELLGLYPIHELINRFSNTQAYMYFMLCNFYIMVKYLSHTELKYFCITHGDERVFFSISKLSFKCRS